MIGWAVDTPERKLSFYKFICAANDDSFYLQVRWAGFVPGQGWAAANAGDQLREDILLLLQVWTWAMASLCSLQVGAVSS